MNTNSKHMTTNQLRREIARRKEWRVVVSQEGTHLWVYAVYRGDGSYLRSGREDSPKYAEASGWSFVPNWPENVEEALELCESIDGFSLTRCGPGWPGKWEASRSWDDGSEYGNQQTVYGLTPALALCQLWLTVMEDHDALQESHAF